jgi:Arc/MetJ-type ribon-helix-helix transcriptional regulator
MPSLTGYATEEQMKEVKRLVGEGKHEDPSEVVNSALRYYLHNKFGVET